MHHDGLATISRATGLARAGEKALMGVDAFEVVLLKRRRVLPTDLVASTANGPRARRHLRWPRMSHDDMCRFGTCLRVSMTTAGQECQHERKA